MKKILCLLGIATMFLTGCGKQDAAVESQTVKKTNSSVNVAVQQETNTVKWFKDTAAAYEKAYPGKKVNIQVIGGTASNYYTKLKLLLQSDSSIDLVYEDSFMLQSDVAAGLLAPINQIKEWNEWSNFYESLRDSAEINGSVYGIPLSTDTRGLFYNTAIFKKAGIEVPWQPKTWKDIIDACETVKKNIPNVSPISLNISATGEQTTMQTLEMLLFGTTSPLYKDGKWIMSSSGMLNSLKFIQELFEKKLTPRLGLLMNPQYGNIAMNQLAPEQKAAIILDGCWFTGRWNLNYPETLKLYKFAAMPTEHGQDPKFITLSGGWLISISSKSKNKEAAMDFLKFAMNEENILNYTKVVSNLSVREDVAKSEKYPEYLRPATELVKYAKFRPANEQYPIVSTKIQAAVESVATQTATPEKAMQTMNASVKRALGAKYVEVIK